MASSGNFASLDVVFQAAVASFEGSLTEKQRREFQGCSRKEVEDTIKAVDGRLASQRKQRNMLRMAKFVEGMDQLGKVIELFVNVDATVAFVWAPIKFVLLAASTWVETLDCILDTYAEIGDFLPSLSKYESLLAKHSNIGIYLQKYYCDVLEFHRKALDIFSRPSWQTAFHSAWRTFKTQFGPVLTKLKRHRDLLSDEKLTATIADVHQSVQSVEDKIDELSRHLQRLHVVDDEGAARRHREDLEGKRQFVLSKLDPPDYHFDLERASDERWDSASGDWLEADAAFGQWVDTTTTQSRALFLTGMPGTGKTILASRVVQHLQRLRESLKGNANGPPFLLLYFFFKHRKPDKRGFVPMLLSLLSQAVFQDEVLLDIVYQRCTQADQKKVRSVSLLRELADLVLGAQNMCFVVVDALDECAGDQSLTAEDAQGQVISWLESLMRSLQPADDEAGSGPSDSCMRLLISGQRNGLLEERLRHWPTIQVDSSLSHMNDIKSYCEAKSLLIQRRFGVLEDVRLDIVDRVTSTAKGMFLYAKVVLGNLLSLSTRVDFKKELQEDNFPKGMDEAYERVAVHILEGPDEYQSDLARRILNLVICAERPLFWKEIQARFCINVEAENADSDFRLLDPGKKYCGALIEVGRKGVPGSQGSEPDDLVELVHETAQKYLVHTGRFHLANLHADMALFCAQYLSSAPFGLDMGEFAVTAHCQTGYYGFLDYAAANWWKHARHIECSKERAFLAALAKLTEALKPRDQTATGNTATGIAAVQTQMHQIPGDGRDCEDAFPIEGRVKVIRACLEPLLGGHANTGSPADLEEMSHLYGRLTYKCSKPWCYYFHTGLETAPARDQHVRQHERPFKCGADGCLSAQIGFARESELARHNERVHSDAVSVHFPSGLRSTIFKAARKGDLELVQEHVASGTSVDAEDRDGSTPLFLAAQAGHYQVCRWLLEHGATVNTRCTRKRITALWAAVANDDLEIASLLIVDHGADIHIRSNTGDHIISLVKRHSCTRIPERFPFEFGYPDEKGPVGPLTMSRPVQDLSIGSHGFQDYQMQLLLQEQRDKTRLEMARKLEESDRSTTRNNEPMVYPQMQMWLEARRNKERSAMEHQGQELQEQGHSKNTGSNHALQDYEIQLRFLELQKNKRPMMEHLEQEQDLTPTTGIKHALQDHEYQRQLLDQQNKKRLMMERQGHGHEPRPRSSNPVKEFQMHLESEERQHRELMERAIKEQEDKIRVRLLELQNKERLMILRQEQEQELSTTLRSEPPHDYQTLLMLEEQKNKKRMEMARMKQEYEIQVQFLEGLKNKRLMMERQEQDPSTGSSNPLQDK